MQILFLTNFYPPAARGGYELWCREVAENLQSKGHHVVILTSKYLREQTRETGSVDVRRTLNLEMTFASLRNSIDFFTVRKAREKANLAVLRETILSFSPDCILVWGMWNLPRSLASLAEELTPGRVAYYIGDYWPTLPSQFENYWDTPARNFLVGLPKRMLRGPARKIIANEKRPDLLFEHALFPTNFMREELKKRGVLPKNSKIIYGAVDTSPFLSYREGVKESQAEGITLLFVGRLTPEKGVHTAIEAVAELINKFGNHNLRLLIVGSGESNYIRSLQGITKQNNIESNVIFLGGQPQDKLPEIFHMADIFLFTSIWPEPFGRVLIEAMASDLAIVGTATGGAAEILIDHINSLLFQPGDAKDLANKVLELMETENLRCKISEAGQRMAIEKFGINRMAEEIESYLVSMTQA